MSSQAGTCYKVLEINTNKMYYVIIRLKPAMFAILVNHVHVHILLSFYTSGRIQTCF
jgi:hypothetical protein